MTSSRMLARFSRKWVYVVSVGTETSPLLYRIPVRQNVQRIARLDSRNQSDSGRRHFRRADQPRQNGGHFSQESVQVGGLADEQIGSEFVSGLTVARRV